MTNKRQFPKIFLWIGAAVVILAVVSAVIIRHARESRTDLPVYATVPEFTFVNQDSISFGSEDLQGKITVLDFFFTNCQGPCPMMSMKMAELYDQYAGAQKVQFVSISVDPARDSLAALQSYQSRYGVSDQRWNFLRAPIGEVRDLSVNGFMLGGDFPMGHSTRFVLIDPQNRIRGYYSSLEDASIEVLRNDIRTLAHQGT
ncbi:MAG TPA: SCO family protein [bacterium]|nr:SCO family protein [bacterium]